MAQKNTILGSCEFSLAYLDNIKRELINFENSEKDLVWAVGGIICSLTSFLLHTCNDVFVEAARSESSSAREDLKLIQAKFNEFIERMIDND